MEQHKKTPFSLIGQVRSLSTPKKITLLVIIVFLIISLLLVALNAHKITTTPEPVTRTTQLENAINRVVDFSDPKSLQDFFVENVRNGVNDNNTKSAIYWITHRYFDNGGDIYEIYDYVQSHPELEFLRKAQILYPDLFAQLKERKVARNSVGSLQAMLAYFEMIDRHGYANIAIWGIAANKYSELAYFVNDLDGFEEAGMGEDKKKEFREIMVGWARYHIRKCDNNIKKITRSGGTLESLITTEGLRPEDALVGLNQYASAIQNMKGMGYSLQNPLSPEEIYNYAEGLARQKVKRLYFFTNYLYATSLINSGEANSESVKIPLDRIVLYASQNNEYSPSRSMGRVVGSNTSHEYGVFRRLNAKQLADLHPEFKKWLMSRGWSADDFR